MGLSESETDAWRMIFSKGVSDTFSMFNVRLDRLGLLSFFGAICVCCLESLLSITRVSIFARAQRAQ